jgi:H+/Cl- antiporter ClcA/predicted transcriptional regulator
MATGRSLPQRKAIDMKEKGDFTADLSLVWLSLLAVPVGLLCAFVALGLQRLIGFFTNVFYFQSFAVPNELVPPAQSPLGWWMVLVPVVGGLIIGFMARYGSERIRGHGIPEAMEAILIGKSRMSPKVAVLKPLSSAISIGSGGPFGAEGPIIMTGGAFGSLIAQAFHLTSSERKTLLVAGAAGGMAATFGTPVAAVLLAVELLLFEWKPRSFVPVALAAAAAALMRPFLGLGTAPLFEVPLHVGDPSPTTLMSAAIVGIAAGLMSLLLTSAVYLFEDAFHRLPIHWMWWPAIGGLAVGIGGLIEPRALGVGYDIIEELLKGQFVVPALVGLMIVKCLIWAIALGSGTSGGVLAPLLIMGGSLGALLSTILPGGDSHLWPLAAMAAVMGGTMRSPLTGIVFALELTYDIKTLLPLLVATVLAHAFTVLVMKRSILTEKVARRGFHVSREYSVDPLERLCISDVMSTNVVSVPAGLRLKALVEGFFLGEGRKHQGYPVVDESGGLIGVVTRSNLMGEWFDALTQGGTEALDVGPVITYDLLDRSPVTAFPGESCRTAAERMAREGVGRLPVVSLDNPRHVIGIITRSDLLKPRVQHLEEEMERNRFLRIPGSPA